MARTITAATQDSSKGQVVTPVAFVELNLDSGYTRVNSSDRAIVFGGNTFLGVGRLGKISAVEEASDLRPAGMNLTLSGIPSTVVSLVLSEPYQGRAVKVWLGLLEGATAGGYGTGGFGSGGWGVGGEPSYGLVADPMLVFQGLIDTMSMDLGEMATVTLAAENRLIRWEQANIRRYTNEDQQAAFSGDLGLEFVSQTAEKEILWGRTGGIANGAGGLPPKSGMM